MSKNLIMTTATLALLAVASGCCCVENADCCGPYCGAGCCFEVTGPVLAEPMPAPAPVVRWPGDASGLVYDWSNGSASGLERRGKAKIDKAGIMQLANGAYLPQGLDAKILEACSRSDELSIEVTLMTDQQSQGGPARIVSFSRDGNARNFTLAQDGQNLVLRLRTRRNNVNGTNPQVTLTKIVTGEPMHVVVSYREGELVCSVNGERVLKTDDLKGDFHNWERMTLILGDEVTGGGRDWNGSIERLAIRSRFLDADAAARQFELTQQDLSE